MTSHDTTDPVPDPAGLRGRIYRALNPGEKNEVPLAGDGGLPALPQVSSVLFLVGPHCRQRSDANQTCLILNKRSLEVKQPGDLCCPGGGISARVDGVISRTLRLPGTPLTRWPRWRRWRRQHPEAAAQLALLMAAGLREAFEEMRLNPLGVTFLGPLPVQQLVMFQRSIYPLVCWVPRQRRYVPNWEVEKIVYIPLASLLDARHYACLRLTMPDAAGTGHQQKDFQSFIHHSRDGHEILWGATFRIAMSFLNLVFGFQPPPAVHLPVIHNQLDAAYLTGTTLQDHPRIKKS